MKFDVGAGTTGGGPDCSEGGNCPTCEAPDHTPCDQGTSDPFEAMGLNCPGEAAVDASVMAADGVLGVRSGFGSTPTWHPTEGSVYVVLSTGLVSDLDNETPTGEDPSNPTYCNNIILDDQFDLGKDNLPPPLQFIDVGGDCTLDPSLVGAGDCSNTLQAQYESGLEFVLDYAQLRFRATVPPETTSISYDIAFFTTEHPYYYETHYNDMYVGWLESETWTGNISFDEQGHPISLNATFLNYQDEQGTLPEFSGTCMRGHAGTEWLTTTAPVVPGEEIEVVFAIFDMSDQKLDSFVFLDNFRWGCEGTSKPTTVPVP